MTAEASLRRRVAGFLGVFLGVFGGFALAHGPGPLYAHAHAALGNTWVDGLHLASGVRLHFSATEAELAAHPWQTTLRVAPAAPAASLTIPIDLRTLAFLPSAAFVALVVAAPLDSWRAHLSLLTRGLLILEPLLLALIAVPLLSFLGGAGPVRAFTLSRPSLVCLEIVYRALVAPPGMAYATPLLVFWGLQSMRRRA